jgi:hypothetical protein
MCFKSVRPANAGEIKFTADRVSCYATLTVKGEQHLFLESTISMFVNDKKKL